MFIVIEHPGGEYTMQLNCCITIRQVKERIQRFLGVPVTSQTLFFNGRLLFDESEVATCGIVHDSRVNLHFRPAFPTWISAADISRFAAAAACQNAFARGLWKDPSRPQPPERARFPVQEPPSSAIYGGGEDPSRSTPSKRRGGVHGQEPPSSSDYGGEGPSRSTPSKRRGGVHGQEPPSSSDCGGEGPSRSPPSKRRGFLVQEPPSFAGAGPQLPEIGGAVGDSAIRRSDSSIYCRESDDLLNFERGLENLEKEADSCLGRKQGSDVTAPVNSPGAGWGGEDLTIPEMESNINSFSSRQIQWSDAISPGAGWGGEDMSLPELERQVLAGNNKNSSSSGRRLVSDDIWPTNPPPPPSGAIDADWPLPIDADWSLPIDADWSLPIDDLGLETLENNIKSSLGHQPPAGAIDADWSIPEWELEILMNHLNPNFPVLGNDVSMPTIPPPSGANNPNFPVLGNDADPSPGHRPESDVTIPTNSPIFYPDLQILGPPAGSSSDPNSWIGDEDLHIWGSSANPYLGHLQEGDVTNPMIPPPSGSSNPNQPILGSRSAGSSSGKMVVKVLPKDGKLKIPVEVTATDKVKELRKKLDRLQIQLPDDYFFIHKQSVMEEELSFLLNGVVSGDTIDIFNGYVTSGSPQ